MTVEVNVNNFSRRMLFQILGILLFFVDGAANAVIAQYARNIILFIPDGLRPGRVNHQDTPTFERVRKDGVYFTNSHSVFSTLTMVNAAALGTGHFAGDTGNFANTIFTGFPVASANGRIAPMIENNAILGAINGYFRNNYLNEESILAAARKAGYATAAVGKVGPTTSFDIGERSGRQTIIIDDMTGRAGGIPIGLSILDALQNAHLPNQAPNRGDNAKVGDAKTPGTSVANLEQQRYFVDVTTKTI